MLRHLANSTVARRVSNALMHQRNFWNCPRRGPPTFWQLHSTPTTSEAIRNAVSRRIDWELLRNFDRETERIFDFFGRRRGPYPSSWFGRNYESEMPIEVVDDDGGRRLALKLDVSYFKPEELKVTLRDNVLTIHARHRGMPDARFKDHGGMFEEYFRQYTLPDDVVTDSITSVLSEDGYVLSIEARLPPAPVDETSKSKEIPIGRSGPSKATADEHTKK